MFALPCRHHPNCELAHGNSEVSKFGSSAYGLLSGPGRANWSHTRSITSPHSPGLVCRKILMPGYQGVSSRSSIQRQSEAYISRSHTGLPNDPARCADRSIYGDDQVQMGDCGCCLTEIAQLLRQAHNTVWSLGRRGTHLQTPTLNALNLTQASKVMGRHRPGSIVVVRRIRSPNHSDPPPVRPQPLRPSGTHICRYGEASRSRDRIQIRGESMRQAHERALYIAIDLPAQSIDDPIPALHPGHQPFQMRQDLNCHIAARLSY